jgi:GT2 family glycosyltransferase
MYKIAIVILNWNGKHFLEEFLPVVVEQSSLEGVKVIVADNASSDESVSYIKNNFPAVGINLLDRNYGFAEGYNRALNLIEAEYFILLNSDVRVTEGWLNPLLLTMESDNDVAACMPKIRAYHQPELFEYAGAAGGFIDKYGYPFCQGRIFDCLEKDFGQYDLSREIFWATGACLMVRGPLFKIMGGFDSRFFAHMEEIDLCWRLKNRGYKIMIAPESIVYHVGGGTLPQSNPRKTYLNFRNNLFLLYRNLPPETLGRIIFIRVLMDFLSAFRFLMKGSFRDILAIIKAHFNFYGNIDYCRDFRREERRFITYNSHRQIYSKSIVIEYFARKKCTFKSLKWMQPDS